MMRRTPMQPSRKPMKRSSFKPRTLLKPSLRRSIGAKVRTWKSAKPTIFRSEEYLAAVRSLDCVCCGRMGATQPAHSNQLRFDKGRSIKGSDATAMALCATTLGIVGCHAKHDQGGTRTKLESWEFEYIHISLTVMALIGDGKLTGQTEVKADVCAFAASSSWEEMAVYFISLIESGQLQVAK